VCVAMCKHNVRQQISDVYVVLAVCVAASVAAFVAVCVAVLLQRVSILGIFELQHTLRYTLDHIMQHIL